jgi:tetratricopeptide (TPR) repeat protein
LAAYASTGSGQSQEWIWSQNPAITGRFVALTDDKLILATNGQQKLELPFAGLSEPEKRLALDYANPANPSNAPVWIPGFRLRYALRVVGDLLTETGRTVMARIPTGGWLKPDASDILVQTATGKLIPVAVLSHDFRGSTIIQFKRNGTDRWYWAYLLNPVSPPRVEPSLAQAIAAAEAAAKAAAQAKMAAQKAAADRAEELRSATDKIAASQTTIANASNEIAQWDKLLPERTAAVDAALARLNAASQTVEKARSAYTAAKAAADEKNAALKKPVEEAAAAQKAAEQAAAAWKAAADAATAARTAADKAGAAEKNAAEQQAAAAAKAARETEAAKKSAEQAAIAKAQAAKVADDAAMPVRLAASKAEAAKDEAEQQFANANAAVKAAVAAVEQGVKARADALALKAASEQTVATVSATVPALTEAVNAARAAAGQAVEAARVKTDAHWKLVADADPSILQEGLTVEIRDWAGDELTDWPVVLAGLRKSETVLGNAIVGEVLQRNNPARPSNPRNFAASYRGFLSIAKPGVYRFFVNGDDAAFIFINGFKVYSRRGSNLPVRGNIKVFSVGADIELEAGVHPFEIHSVIGNTPTAIGSADFLWLTPDSKAWELVPRDRLTRAVLAVPAAMQEASGGQAAAFNYGIDDSLVSEGINLYLMRFEACGAIKQPGGLTWDFGDGTTGSGRSVTHVYFREGDYEVALTSQSGLPAFRRRVHVWTAPAPTSPASLAQAVEALGAMDLNRLDPPRLNAMFQFLLICGQPNRWPLMERLCRNLLARGGLDLQYRIALYTSLMEAVAQQGRGAEALALTNTALAQIPRLKTLQAAVTLKAAEIQRNHLKDFKAAAALYEQILAQSRRLNHPIIRAAAVALGDMYADLGDQAHAAEAYRLAGILAAGVAGEKQTDAATRGALLRVAEQQLKEGNARQSARLLERIETDYPEQKIEGLYRFLRAEADRFAGRYDEAIRNYESLLQLRQWAGYRGQVLYGLADSYYRMGVFSNALEWLAPLKETAPEYYEEKKIADVEAMIAGRVQRRQEAAAAAATNPALAAAAAPFTGYATGFEPGENPAVTNAPPPGYRFRPTLGFEGPFTGCIEGLPQSASEAAYYCELRNVASEGEFWVEVWYRDTLAPTYTGSYLPQIYVNFYGDANQLSAQRIINLLPTYGEWRKIAARVTAPVTKDGRVAVVFYYCLGFFEFDGLRVLPISDRQNDVLQTFIEGTHPQ